MRPGSFTWSTQEEQKLNPRTFEWGTPTRALAPKQPGYFKRFSTGFKTGFRQTFDEGAPNAVEALKFKENFVVDSMKAWGKAYSGVFKDSAERFERALRTFKNDPTEQEKWLARADSGLGIVNIAFAPIIAIFKSAEHVPAVGLLATEVNAVFGGIASGSAEIGLKRLEESDLEPETKERWAPVVSELSGLLGVLAAGKAGHKTYQKMSGRMNDLMKLTQEETAKRLTVQDRSPGSRSVELNRFYDETNLPVIDWGPGKKSTLPVIDFGAPSPTPRPKISGARYVYGEERVPTTRTTPVTTGNRFQSKTALRTADESGISRSEVPFETRRPQQYENADIYVAKDTAAAEAALVDTSKVPKGLLPGDIYKALEAYARETGDFALQNRLAKIHYRVATEAGRGLKAFDRPLDEISYTSALRGVIEARKAAVEAKGVKVDKEVAKVQREAGEIKPPKIKDWDTFIKELAC